jgi:hypothetical protein
VTLGEIDSSNFMFIKDLLGGALKMG